MSVLSKITGADAAHNAGQMMNQSKQQQAQALGYQQQAQGGYQNILGQGNNFLNQYQNLWNSSLPAYQQAAGIGSSTSPYGLSAIQQRQLNSQLDTLASGQQSALSQAEGALGRQGLLTPSAQSAYDLQVAQQFGGLRNQAIANMQQNANQMQLSALSNLLQLALGLGNTGMNALQSGSAGLAGLGAQALGGSAQSQEFANQQQQMSNAALGNLLNIATFAGGGGFNWGLQKQLHS